MSSAGALHESLERVRGRVTADGVDVAGALEVLAARPFKPAAYFCAGDTEHASEYHHYALNFAVYTHFTSPIRR
jgi:exoribonuclease R